MPGALPLWLPGGSSWYGQLKGDPQFASLSPASQQTLLQYADQMKGNGDPQAFAAAMKSDPALASAMQEAQEKGALSHPITPFMKGLMLAIAAVGTAGIASAALAGGGAAVGGAGSAGADATLASMAPGAEGGLAAGAGTTAATTAATAAGGGSLLHALLPSIIGAGASLGGTAIAANANSEAAKIAAAQADKALAVQQQQYALQRQDTAPYRALGIGAVNNLGYLGGIDTTSNLKALSDINPTVNPPPSTAVAPGAVDASGKSIPGAPPSSSLTPPTMAQQMTNNTSGAGTVRIQDPATGMVHLIPQASVAAAQQAGGRLV